MKGRHCQASPCGIGGVAHRSPAGRRDEAVTGVEVVQCAALLGCCSDWVPKVGLAETSWCVGSEVLHAEATQVPQPHPRQRTLTPEQRAMAARQKLRVGEVSE